MVRLNNKIYPNKIMLTAPFRGIILTAIGNMGREFSTHNLIDFIRDRPCYKEVYREELRNIVNSTGQDETHAEQVLHSAVGRHLLGLNNMVRKIDTIESENVHGTLTEELAYWRKIS